MAKDDTTEEEEKSIVEGRKWRAPADMWLIDRGKTKLAVAQVKLPGDKKWTYLVYAIDPEDVDKFDWSKAKKRDFDDREFKEAFPPNQRMKGGNALELTGIDEGTSIEDWFEDTWQRYVGYNPVISTNHEIARLYAQSLLEGWTESEVKNSVEGTKWWQNRSTEQRQFLLLSPAQQTIAVNEQAANLANSYFNDFGRVADSDSAYIQNLAQRVASGRVSYASAVETMRQKAKKDPNTPWATRVREYNRRGVDIENKTGELRDRTAEWGVRMEDSQLNRWAQRINDLDRSDEDFATTLKDLAESQWGSVELGTSNRKRDTSVDEWASPYMGSYTRLMERGNATSTDVLFDDQFRTMLDPRMSVGEFEKAIRKSGAWRNTNNGKAASNEMLARVGQILGYS